MHLEVAVDDGRRPPVEVGHRRGDLGRHTQQPPPADVGRVPVEPRDEGGGAVLEDDAALWRHEARADQTDDVVVAQRGVDEQLGLGGGQLRQVSIAERQG